MQLKTEKYIRYNNYLNTSSVSLFLIVLCLHFKGQTWVAPAGGFYNNQLYYNLYADNINGVLYHRGPDTNVLTSNSWQKWYQNGNLLANVSEPFLYTDQKNYSVKQFNEGNNPLKPRTALLQWTNGQDLDTVRIFKGTYNLCCPNIYNGKFYLTVYHDTIGYKSYISEFDGQNLLNPIFDSIWKHPYSIGQTLTYKNEIYAIGNFKDGHRIIVYKNGNWNLHPPWSGVDNGIIVKMIIFNTRLYFVGGFWKQENPTLPGNSVIAWDGNNWDDLGGGLTNEWAYLNGYANDATVCRNKIYFVGPFSRAGGLSASKVVTWNDTSWCQVGGDLDSSFSMVQIECFKDTIYVEGNFSNVHGTNLGTIGKMQNMDYVDSCKLLLTSVPENGKKTLIIFVVPNPVSDKLYIEMAQGTCLLKLTLYNTLGQIVREIHMPEGKVEIEFENLQAGVYLLKAEDYVSQKTFKVIKE